LHSFRLKSAQCVVKFLRTYRPVQIIMYQVHLRPYIKTFSEYLFEPTYRFNRGDYLISTSNVSKFICERLFVLYPKKCVLVLADCECFPERQKSLRLLRAFRKKSSSWRLEFNFIILPTFKNKGRLCFLYCTYFIGLVAFVSNSTCLQADLMWLKCIGLGLGFSIESA